MIRPDPIIVETVDRLLEEQCSADVINAAEEGRHLTVFLPMVLLWMGKV